jgi:hypothetical protein
MQIGKAFSFPFEDKSWLSKLLLAGVISVVPILNFAWTGYVVELVKNVIDHRITPLPEWSDFGKKFVDGLLVTVAYFVYSLPALLVGCLMSGVVFVPAIISGSANASENLQKGLGGAASVAVICLSCLLALYALVLVVLLPGILANFAQKRTFASCFELSQIYRTVTAHSGTYFMVVLVVIAASVGIALAVGLVSTVFSAIPILGWCLGPVVSFILFLLTVVYTGVVSGHLVGQYGAEAYNAASGALPESEMTMIQ